MYAGGRTHPYRAACRWVLTEVTEGRMDVATDTEVIQEILYRFGALRRFETGIAMARALFDLVPVLLPVTAADASLAVDLFARYARQGVRARDVLHAAVMRNNGITEIISTDRHFDRIDGISRLDPAILMGQADQE